MTNLPVCNGTSPSWINYITGIGGIIDQWFALGIDGLRLDVADDLTDEFIENINLAVKRNKKDGLIIGEVWENFMRKNREYIAGGKGMHTAMNYPLMDSLIRYFKYCDTERLSGTLWEMLYEYPEETINILMNSTSTHDISRPLNIFGTYEDFSEKEEWIWDVLRKNDRQYCQKFKLTKEQYNHAKNIYESYVATLAFMPGILSIFYGDEVGVEGLGNLSNRKPFPWENEDQELLEFFTGIGKVRATNSFLEKAKLNVLTINREFIMFERKTDEEKLLVAVNRTENQQDLYIPQEYEDSYPVYSLKKSSKYHLNPYGAIALKKNNNKF